jgi:glutathionylspermidine synthase
MDLAYDGNAPPKLYELKLRHADRALRSRVLPVDLVRRLEARGTLARGTPTNTNAIQETSSRRSRRSRRGSQRPLAFGALRDCPEDEAPSRILRDCAQQAGLDSAALAIEDIGLTSDGRFVDLGRPRDRHAVQALPARGADDRRVRRRAAAIELQLVEPPWKAILSNKGVLPLLWERIPIIRICCPPISTTIVATALAPGWVRKPLSLARRREHRARHADGRLERVDGPYGDGAYVRQALHALPRFAHGGFPLVGSWLIARPRVGHRLREDDTPITRDTSRYRAARDRRLSSRVEPPTAEWLSNMIGRSVRVHVARERRRQRELRRDARRRRVHEGLVRFPAASGKLFQSAIHGHLPGQCTSKVWCAGLRRERRRRRLAEHPAR